MPEVREMSQSPDVPHQNLPEGVRLLPSILWFCSRIRESGGGVNA